MTALPAEPPLLPTWRTPVVAPTLVVAPGRPFLSIYADDDWSLAPMIANPGAARVRIDWSPVPAALREEMRLAAWMMINTELPAGVLVGHPAWHSRLGPHGIYDTVRRWHRFAHWLTEQGIPSLAGCTADSFTAYAAHHANRPGATRGDATKELVALTRLWAFDAASAAPAGPAMPPWQRYGVDDYLPAVPAVGRGENSREPLAEGTIGPLLIWALRMVDDFAADILAARQEAQDLTERAEQTAGTRESMARLARYLDRLVERGEPVPARRHKGEHQVSLIYIAAQAGCPPRQVNSHLATDRRKGLRDYLRSRPGRCPLSTQVTGTVGGRPWAEALDFTEIPQLMRHLATACFIVLAYLTGMRPGEVMALESGCCPEPDPPGRYLIHGRVFKGVLDPDGNHHSPGQIREVPWVAIAPVVSAIRVLEHIAPDGLLFDTAAHTVPRGRAATGRTIHLQAMRTRIEDFAAFASDLARRLDRPHEVVPADPHGAIGTARFRRSLAWHIARRPGGLVALAVQYGHLRTAVSAGYAARGRDGIHELLNIETARATADTLTTLNDDLAAGAGISGPAARRAIHAAAQAPAFAGSVRTHRQALDILNQALTVHDNPQAFLMCVYQRDRALCHRTDITDAPRLDRCRPACANIARTDRHADDLVRHAQTLEKQAASHAVPGPLADRLASRAARLRGIADHHEHNRISLQEPTP
ncbi:integrase [Kitasatospora sp. NPDC058444]|uniref:integrase n=1 Tax=Kitasatospora sp. NPDC058444 TaxID=3346504 RepID=UPI00364C7CAA